LRMSDDFFELRNLFFLGNFQAAINEGTSLTLDDAAAKRQRDFFLYRSYVELGDCQIVLDELKASTGPLPAGLRFLARAKLNGPTSVIAELTDALTQPTLATDSQFQTIAAYIYAQNESFDEALKLIHTNASLECQALVVQIYATMGRPDLAVKSAKQMHQSDEDASLTQLALATANLAQGGAGYKEAADGLRELGQRYGMTPRLLNGLGIALLNQGKVQEAEGQFIAALEKNNKDPDTLINLSICQRHLRKPGDVVARTLAQAKTQAPSHPYFRLQQQSAEAFDRAAARHQL